jgi:hypothetical protein
MSNVEYAIDVWDLTGRPEPLDAEELHRHLRDFGAEGWELVSITFGIELARHGQSHLLIFRRPG